MTSLGNDNQTTGIKLIAKLANVSIGTVDRVLHGRSGVAKETKERVLKIVEELNYKPNIIARRLVSKKKYRFAVLIPSSDNDTPFWRIHEKGIKKAENEIHQLGILIEKFYFQLNSPSSFSANANKIIEGNFDGVLLVPFFQGETIEFTKLCIEKNIPFIYFDTNLQHETIAPLAFVGQDAFQSGYFAGKLASYFLKPSETSLTISINSAKRTDIHANYFQREEGFRKFNEDNQAFKSEILNISETDSENLSKLVKETLEKNNSIKVIYITNSRAYKIASILEKNKINGIKLIGYDLTESNKDFLNKGTIDFLISQDPVEQGYQGIMCLYNYLILGAEISTEKLMPINLILKENMKYHKD